MNYDITDFSAKDSKEYDSSTNLFEDAGRETSSLLEGFKDTFYYKDPIPTKLNKKTHNSEHYLDEDFLSKKKMNANTSAIKELIKEQLMYGSTEEDLENELTDGGVAEEIAQVFANHGITGKAVKDSFKKLETYYGADFDVNEFSNGASDEDDFEDASGAESESAEETVDSDVESDDSDGSIEEKFNNINKMFRRNLIEKRIKKRMIARRNLRIR